MNVTRSAALLLAIVLLGGFVSAEGEPAPKHRTLVELFTSQG